MFSISQTKYTTHQRQPNHLARTENAVDLADILRSSSTDWGTHVGITCAYLHFFCCGDRVDKWFRESRNTLRRLIKHLHPSPAGVIGGGGFNEDQKEGIKSVAREHGLRFVGVPYMYMRDHGPEETLQWCRNTLLKEFEVE